MKFSSNNNFADKDYFLQEIVISKVDDITGSKIFGPSDRPSDAAIEVFYNPLNKLDATYSFKLGGTFKVNANGEIISLGNVSKITFLFKKLNIKYELNTDEIPIFKENLLNELVGKKMYILKYVYSIDDSGKKMFALFKNFDTDKEKLEQYFLKQVEAGWVKDFKGVENVPILGELNGIPF